MVDKLEEVEKMNKLGKVGLSLMLFSSALIIINGNSLNNIGLLCSSVSFLFGAVVFANN